MSRIHVELIGFQGLAGAPGRAEIESLCTAAAATAGVSAGHLAIELTDPERIAELNARHTGKAGPTDVISFPIDGAEPLDSVLERELGDVVICPQHTADIREAIVHGVLHLVGMDHETDSGEMLAVQAKILASASGGARGAPVEATSGAHGKASGGAREAPAPGGTHGEASGRRR